VRPAVPSARQHQLRPKVSPSTLRCPRNRALSGRDDGVLASELLPFASR